MAVGWVRRLITLIDNSLGEMLLDAFHGACDRVIGHREMCGDCKPGAD